MDILNYGTHALISNLNLLISDCIKYNIDDKKLYFEFTMLVKKLAQMYDIILLESSKINSFKVSREIIRISNGKIMQSAETLKCSESQFEVVYVNKISSNIKNLYVSFTTIEVIPKKCFKIKVKHNLLTRLHMGKGEALSISPNIYYKLELPDDFKGSGEIEIIWIGYR